MMVRLLKRVLQGITAKFCKYKSLQKMKSYKNVLTAKQCSAIFVGVSEKRKIIMECCDAIEIELKDHLKQAKAHKKDEEINSAKDCTKAMQKRF